MRIAQDHGQRGKSPAGLDQHCGRAVETNYPKAVLDQEISEMAGPATDLDSTARIVKSTEQMQQQSAFGGVRPLPPGRCVPCLVIGSRLLENLPSH